ncbi:hypothetical protein LTR08_007080 [Meristemomyces frigidus]|nr:hypothetical protein LTR08_007080 [Meristemomyces frigidus]
MPWLGTDEPADASARQWKLVLRHALLRRITADQLAAPLKELAHKHPCSGKAIAYVLMGFRAAKGGVDDPLLFRYTEHLLKASYVGTGDILSALLTHRIDPSGHMPTCEERVFTLLAQLYLNGSLSTSQREAHGTTLALVRWFHAVYESEYNKQLESGLHTLEPFACGMYDALGSLAITILGAHRFRAVAKQHWWKERRPIVVREMVNFDMHVLQWMNSQLSGRLQAISNMPPFVDTDVEGRPIINGQEILASVTDLPVVHTRAALYVWLNACLCGRPLTDDMTMLGYLQARYAGDNQRLAIALLTAAFDVLTNSMLRKEPRHVVKCARSFICNKMPLLLSMLSAYLAPMTTETCIQMAFMQITMDALPPITAGAADVRDILKRTRMECLQACALHSLVSESAVGSILQEPPMALPQTKRYTKDSLVSQCSNNVGRLEQLAEDLQSMQGNAGAVAGCILEIIRNLCSSKDTMSLKTVCTILIRRIPDMDIVMQYTQPASILAPLCSLLHEWVHDQDQTEFTPSYEEFASILLFTLAVVHRYDLTKEDVGLAGAENFVFQLLDNVSTSVLPEDLATEQSAQLSMWIEGLFATDEHGETSGISDDVMRQCSPQAFYGIVPTLFEQSVLACKSSALSASTLTGGLELLLEPFLLPSLLGGLSWLIKHSWEDHGDADLLLQILDKLLSPSSSSQEIQAMHKAILAMVAVPLICSLQELLRKRPDKKAVIGLIELLKPHVSQRRTRHASKAELEEWAATPGGGWASCVRNSVRDVVAWSSSVGPNPPSKYTHKMFSEACRTLGAEVVLSALVAEIKEHTANGTGPQALDVCVAMISAPVAVPLQQAALAVRDELQLTVLDFATLQEKPLSDAEALIRLNRRVEAQRAAPQITQMALPLPVPDQSTDQIMHEFGLTDANGTSGAVGTLSMDQAADLGEGTAAAFSTTAFDTAMSSATVDLTGTFNQNLANFASSSEAMQMDQNVFGDIRMNMDQSQQPLPLSGDDSMMAGAGDTQQSQEDDIFADLMGDFTDDFSFT